MPDELANERWREALDRLDSLTGPAWPHIPAFRDRVLAIARSSAARGLHAAMSHETLTMSPYTRAPDCVEGRRVQVCPLPDGRVRVTAYLDPTPQTWTLDPEPAQDRIIALISQL